jgi:uncharacterized protein (DUF924 family)
MQPDTPAGALAEVLDFWFGAPPFQTRGEWFRKSETFDATVRQRFGPQVEAVLGGELPVAWGSSPQSRLAAIIMLDQFTRNIYRGTARAFAGDAQALALAREMVWRGADQALAPMQRWFAYLPFEHAEDAAMQDESLRLFQALATSEPSLAAALDYAQRHREVIRRYGRFPHRNAQLQRASTADELEYLAQPGSGF